MVTFNRLIMAGNLTRDPEIRYQPSGKSVTTFAMACNERYRAESGETKETVTYIDVVVWGKMGENCAEYLKKGSPTLVEGKLRQRRWEKEGQKFSKHEMVATAVQFLGGRRSDAGGDAELPGEDVPF